MRTHNQPARRTQWLLAFGILLGLPFGAGAQTTTPSVNDQQAAITKGQHFPKSFMGLSDSSEITRPPFGIAKFTSNTGNGFRLTLGGPLRQIFLSSRFAARQAESFALADVTPEMLTRYLSITVEGLTRAHIPTGVLVRVNGQNLHPIKLTDVPTVWQNRFGATSESQDIIGLFRLEDIPADNGFEVMVLSLEAPKVVSISAKERAVLR